MSKINEGIALLIVYVVEGALVGAFETTPNPSTGLASIIWTLITLGSTIGVIVRGLKLVESVLGY